MARCAICHKRLTDPQSIKMGIGPECRSGKGKKASILEIKIARRNALDHHQPVEVGKDSITHQPVIFKPDENGNYVGPGGAVWTAEGLEIYLKRWGLIHTNSVAPMP